MSDKCLSDIDLGVKNNSPMGPRITVRFPEATHLAIAERAEVLFPTSDPKEEKRGLSPLIRLAVTEWLSGELGQRCPDAKLHAIGQSFVHRVDLVIWGCMGLVGVMIPRVFRPLRCVW